MHIPIVRNKDGLETGWYSDIWINILPLWSEERVNSEYNTGPVWGRHPHTLDSPHLKLPASPFAAF